LAYDAECRLARESALAVKRPVPRGAVKMVMEDLMSLVRGNVLDESSSPDDFDILIDVARNHYLCDATPWFAMTRYEHISTMDEDKFVFPEILHSETLLALCIEYLRKERLAAAKYCERNTKYLRELPRELQSVVKLINVLYKCVGVLRVLSESDNDFCHRLNNDDYRTTYVIRPES
jgi:hypothetical protein